MRRHIALLAALLAPTPAFAVWPADSLWSPVPGAGVLDSDNDRQVGGAFLELTGTVADPTLWWAIDATNVYFRIHVVENPTGAVGNLDNGAWGVTFDTDAVPTTYELLLEASTSFGALQLFENSTGAAGLDPDVVLVSAVGSYPNQVRVVATAASGSGSYLDVQIPRATLLASGIAPSTPFHMGTFTRDPLGAGWSDVSGCSTLVGCGAEDTTSDEIAIDADSDGLTYTDETAVGSDPEDADTDDDGLTDGDEWFADTVLTDWDSDGDGLSDGLELGVTAPDADTLVGAGHFTVDADPATTTDPERADTDSGGVDDGVEDWNGNGKVDTFETDPNDFADDVDTDGDTIPDAFDGMNGNPVSDIDSDGDGLTDEEEFLYDTDEDGTPDFLDDDSDGDGIPDVDEGNVDSDGDGIPDHLDEDSDDDGVPDAAEGGEDTDGDGVPDYLDDDSDGDGISDEDEVGGDLDGDGDEAVEDPDDNGDGVTDGDQLGDTDGDGTPDHLDEDTDGDGIPNTEEGTDDPDEDGDGNATDTDSDGDGKPDADEGTGDDDCDGIPNYQDADDLDGNCDSGQPIPGVDTGDSGDTGVDGGGDGGGVNDGYGPGEFTGGACSSAPGAASFLPIALAALLLRRRRRAVVAAALAVAPTAGAQEVNAQRFTPNQDRSTFAKLQDADVGDGGEGGFGLWLGYTDDPLVFRPESGEEVPVVGGLATGWLTGSYSLGPLRIGGALPFHGGGGDERTIVLGDGQIGGEIAAWKTGIFHFGMFADANLPMGDPAASLGSGGLRGRGGLIGRFGRGPARLALNLGVQSGTGRSLGELDVSPAVIGGLGLSYELTDALSAAIEVDGEQWLGSQGASGARPAEWLASGQYATDLATFRLGAGSGLSQGVGAPDFRVIAGVLFAPDRIKPVPMPIADAEPPPPAPVVAPAPADASLVVRVISPNGEPIRGANVRVVGREGDAKKAGPDGILETTVPAGAHEVVVSADGWQSAKTVVNAKAGGQNDVQLVLQPNSDIVVDAVAGRIYLQRKVFFEVDRAELTRESLAVLDRLVEVLVQRPEVQKIRVEGHTDSTGNDQHNLELSQARAQSVVNYLVKAGIAASRLEAQGFGETRPLQQGETPDILATNRRVEFHIIRMGDQVTPGETEE